MTRIFEAANDKNFMPRFIVKDWRFSSEISCAIYLRRLMQAIITVFKVELNNREQIFKEIKEMSSDLSEVGEAYTFSPKPGKLFELLTLLKNNNINYGTHFNVSEGLPPSYI